MLLDFRLWLALSVFFLSASGVSLLTGMIARRKRPSTVVYFFLALLFSIGIGFYLEGQIALADLLNPVMALFFVLGILSGISPFFIPLALIGPILYSQIVHIPMKPLKGDDQFLIGTIKFYPSNEGFVIVDWIDFTGREQMYQLEGESAAIVIQKQTLPAYLFFLKNNILPVGILSRSVSIQDLPDENTAWFQSLETEPAVETALYDISYPALKFYPPRFFNTIEISVSKGKIFHTQK